MRWSRIVDPKTGVEEWELSGVAPPLESCPRDAFGALVAPRWTIYRVRGRATRTNPSGEYFRAMCNGAVVRAGHRVRSWLSRHAAMGAVEELARRGS